MLWMWPFQIFLLAVSVSPHQRPGKKEREKKNVHMEWTDYFFFNRKHRISWLNKESKERTVPAVDNLGALLAPVLEEVLVAEIPNLQNQMNEEMQVTQDVEAHLRANPLMLLAMLCEHSHWSQCVPLFVYACCKVLRNFHTQQGGHHQSGSWPR